MPLSFALVYWRIVNVHLHSRQISQKGCSQKKIVTEAMSMAKFSSFLVVFYSLLQTKHQQKPVAYDDASAKS